MNVIHATSAMGAMLVPLAELMDELRSLHDALYETLCGKLEAMRRSDVEGMLSSAHREGELATQISAADGRRAKVVADLCDALGLEMEPRRKGNRRGIRLSEIVSRLTAQDAGPIHDRAAQLRASMLRVAQANRVVELVCREMLAHFRTLFGAMMDECSETGTYRAGGAMEKKPGPRVLDAVG